MGKNQRLLRSHKSFVHKSDRSSFPNFSRGMRSPRRIIAQGPAVPTKYVYFCVKWRATGRKGRLLWLANCHLYFVFMHIPGGSFIFNIS
jgi:hypothetical protein